MNKSTSTTESYMKPIGYLLHQGRRVPLIVAIGNDVAEAERIVAPLRVMQQQLGLYPKEELCEATDAIPPFGGAPIAATSVAS